MKNGIVVRVAVFFSVCVLSSSVLAAEIKVAAAADLKFAMDEIIEKYQNLHPEEKVSAIYGASGIIATQIKEGAPFDLFFSADTEKIESLIKAGKTVGETFSYGHGHVVVWVKNESKLTLDGALKCLLDPGIKKIAVANPISAPYGKIAAEALKNAGLYDQLSGKMVVGENIAQTAQFVESSAADVGLIAKSLALSPVLKKQGRFTEVDSSLYVPLLQSGAIIKGANVASTQKFKDYFLSAAGGNVLNAFGLGR